MARLTPEEARLLGARLIWGPEEGAPEEVGAEGLGEGAFGRYHLVRLIGLGGMGAVYEAEQDSPKRRVAIKVIRPELMSAEVARRFEHEARILGRLQHPGIAQIYEAGRVEGGAGGPTPYFAMEFVEGVPLTEFAKAGGLGVRARLELFLRACEAVEHAHRMGVIHRDLKPGNILVDAEGRARILDFGVARATDADVRAATMHTEAGKLLGTLPYMSPEQVAGDADGLDTRSDVYSLGVVLYELLAEKPPYEVKRGPVHEAARVITETEPAPLSTVSRVFRGDLETIVGKALAKERERRYQSVGELAADIRRYLNDEPIVARRAGKWYQWKKFLRRNRGAAWVGIGSVGALVVITVVSVVLAVGQAAARAESERLRRSEQRQRAESDRQRAAAVRGATTAKAVTDFFKEMLLSAAPKISAGKELTVREALQLGAERVISSLPAEPSARVQVESAIADAYLDLGERELASPLAEKAYSDGVHELGEADPVTIRAAMVLGRLYSVMGKSEDADTFVRRELEVAIPALGAEDRTVLDLWGVLGSTLDDEGKYEEALEIGRRSREAYSRLDGSESVEALRAGVFEADCLTRLGRFKDAEDVLLPVVETMRRTLPSGSTDLLDGLGSLGLLYNQSRQPSLALPVLRELVAIQTQVLGPEHPKVLSSRNNLASAMWLSGDADGAAREFRELLPIRRRVEGDRDPSTLATINNFSLVLRSKPEWRDEASVLSREVYEARLDTLGEAHPSTITSMLNLGLVLLDLGKSDDGLELIARAVELRRQVLGPDNSATVTGQKTYGEALRKVGREAEAEAPLRFAAERADANPNIDRRSRAEAHDSLGRCLVELGHVDEGVAELDRALTLYVELGAASETKGRQALAALASTYAKLGRQSEADALPTRFPTLAAPAQSSEPSPSAR